jgi:uncharacterized protein with GYD domain
VNVESARTSFVNAYITLGEYDGLIIFDAPDDTTAAAIAMATVSPGHHQINENRASVAD